MQPFDPINSRLHGTCLIEAGAGTGKTYTITTIVLRLILQEALPPEQILVVTFTTAATAELRERIRRRLQAARGLLLIEASDDEVLAAMLDLVGSRALALERLEDALANFDRMPIFTIHGFCQRILGEMAFETGSSFDAELMKDSMPVIQGLTDDFWRKCWSDADPELISYAKNVIDRPDALAEMYHHWAKPDLTILPEKATFPEISFSSFRACRAELSQIWQLEKKALLAMLTSTSLKANIYGSLDQPAGRADGRNKREEKIAAWTYQIEAWIAKSSGNFALPKALSYFSQSKLCASAKKGTQAPQHAFFEMGDRIREEAERLEVAMEEWVTALLAKYFDFMKKSLARVKSDKQVLFFDDLLVMVRNGLQQDKRGQLRRALQSRYRAALIDEFQDTDSIQYDIFSSLFSDGSNLLFMIGDPKQAIYSFRGADIFTYLHASRKADQQYTLVNNWRSTPGMVAAVNTLFSQCPEPFFWSAIPFRQAVAAQDTNQGGSGTDSSPAMKIWFIDNPIGPNGRYTLNKAAAAERIGGAVAMEIRRLALERRQGDAPIRFSDMAVLVRTNRQARHMKNLLMAADIPAVVYNAGSVFHLPEALDLRRVIAAVVEPSQESNLRGAMITPLFGYDWHDLDFSSEVPPWWEEVLERFYDYREIWHKSGFIRMVRRLMLTERISQRLLAKPAGERYLTNILHMVELLHQADSEKGLGMRDLIVWLDQQRHQAMDSVDAHQMRLESDDEAVTILTVHKSKGLEFSIVFCPYSWEGFGAIKPPAIYHDNDLGERRALDLGSTGIQGHLDQMAEERMAEELRLLYVAATRAKHRCYLAWGRLPSSEYSALAFLMFSEQDSIRKARTGDTLQRLKKAFLDHSSAAHRQRMIEMAQDSGGTIAITALPDGPFDHEDLSVDTVSLSAPRIFKRGSMPFWKIASFSSLIKHRSGDNEILEDAPGWKDEVFDRSIPVHVEFGGKSLGDIGTFEASARTGLFFHEILERIDFRKPTGEEVIQIITTNLKNHGFESHWRDAVLATILRIVQTPLHIGHHEKITLQEIALSDRINELGFHFPLNAIDADQLGQIFANYHQANLDGRLSYLTEQLDFRLSGGYLKGFIDLVFRINGRYYIIDWKSNHLGDSYEAYHPVRLAAIMETDYYFLQYHLYTVALDQYLRASCPGYSYTNQFGGVFYLFIRGMEPSLAYSPGVFFDRPAPRLIAKLRRILIR